MATDVVKTPVQEFSVPREVDWHTTGAYDYRDILSVKGTVVDFQGESVETSFDLEAFLVGKVQEKVHDALYGKEERDADINVGYDLRREQGLIIADYRSAS